MSFQRIRDPLHNVIEFSSERFEQNVWQLIQSRVFQRLRRVKQLGFSDYVYPGGSHTRFAHSIGVFHTARLLMNVVHESLRDQHDRRRAEVSLVASLLHDVGHGPFSHAFESVGKRLNLKYADHEEVGDVLIREGELAGLLNKLFGTGFAEQVADLIGKNGQRDIYTAIVSSQFDADRLDYMRRDRLMTGTQHGAIDFDWLLSNLEVGSVNVGVDDQPLPPVQTFVLGPKAIHAAETYVLGLFQLYPTVYFHKATRGAEKAFAEIIFQIIMLARDGSSSRTGLPESHPLIIFARDPESIENVLALDDTVFTGSLSMLSSAPDKCISYLAQHIQSRTLYKSIDVREKIRLALSMKRDWALLDELCENLFQDIAGGGIRCLNDIALQQALKAAIRDRVDRDHLDLACTKAFELLSSKDVLRDGPPKVIVDEARRRPYNRIEESKGPLDQILIRSSADGPLLDVAVVSKVVAAIEDYKLLRAYIPRENTGAEKQVSEAIEEGVRYALAS